MENFTNLYINDIRNNKKQFNRFLSIGLIFILFGYFYIVSPYFLYKNEDQNAKAEIQAAIDSIEVYRMEVEELRKVSKNVNSELDRIEENIYYFPDELARSLALINTPVDGSNESPHFQQNRLPVNQLGIPDSIVNYSNRVGWYINHWFDNLLDDINKNIIIPSTTLDPEKGKNKKSEIRTLANEAVNKIKNHIERIDPDFWHSYDRGKLPVARQLEDVVEESLKPVILEIDTLVNVSKDIELVLQRKIESDSVALLQYAANIKLIEKRIESVESPIGKIPLNLVDFVQLFPVLIIILAVMLTNYVAKCIRSMGNLRKEFEKIEDEQSIKSMKIISDCWFLPPFRSIFPAFILIASVVLIIGIYVLSVTGLLQQPDLFVSLTGAEEPMKKNIFFFGYGLGVLILIGCFWYINRQLKSTYPLIKLV